MKFAIFRRILATAMDIVRPFLKLNVEQDAAWSVVRSIVDNPPR